MVSQAAHLDDSDSVKELVIHPDVRAFHRLVA